MTSIHDPNNPDIQVGDSISGYKVIRIVELKEIDSVFYELDHSATGSRHIHISNTDAENTFSVAFKTVPADSTGVAHILEHTVLCGSKKFPVRDPFFSMLKRSLSTFMNAFTASDWTMYPFSTQNRTDFYNLMDVYLDSAFLPNIDRLSFKQEGHRLEIESDENGDKLVYKGVVYNEMKGAMSSPDQIFTRSLLKALYPDTTYSNNSGGDPAIIPQLTHEQLKAFHQRHYHPSNAFFYTYGNLPLAGHLDFIHEKILKNAGRIDPKTDVSPQPRWDSPREASATYPLNRNEKTEKKAQVAIAWLTADIQDSFEVLTLSLLEQILLGNSASPLRKALIDSGLGSTLCDGTGFDADNRDTMFVCGLKDVNASDADAIQRIVFDVFKSLCRDGIDRNLIDSAIHQIEFHRKEITNTPYPYGLRLLLTFGGSWFHGGDPEKVLRFDDDLERLNQELEKGNFFEQRIRDFFLDNPHRVRFTMTPDLDMAEKEERRVTEELSARKAELSPTDLHGILQDAEALTRLQETEEDLSALPTLALEEIPPSVHMVSPSSGYDDTAATCYRQSTSDIFYFSAAAGSGALGARMLPLVPFFCYALPKVGTAMGDYIEMARRIDATTGGIGLSSHSRTRFDDAGECLPFISFNAKCLGRNIGPMFDILEAFLCTVDFTDHARLKNLLLEYRAGLESSIVNNGHRLAISLASRNFSPTLALSELWSGIHQVRYIKDLVDTLTDDTLASLAENLTQIGQSLFGSTNLDIALIGEDPGIAAASAPLNALKKRLGHTQTAGFVSPEITPEIETPREGWSTASAVSFVASAFKTVRMEHEDSAALAVISKILRSMYLHREIREKGGAYGGFAVYNPEDGLFCFGSYRDPHIVSTLNVYRNGFDFIRAGNYTDESVKEAILQVCSEIDKPDPPGPAARKAFYRDLVSLTDDARNRFKSRLLKLNRDQVLRAAERHFNPDQQVQGVAVISGEEKLTAANEQMADHPLTLHRI